MFSSIQFMVSSYDYSNTNASFIEIRIHNIMDSRSFLCFIQNMSVSGDNATRVVSVGIVTVNTVLVLGMSITLVLYNSCLSNFKKYSKGRCGIERRNWGECNARQQCTDI